jgi:hypothetical protein
MKSVGSGTRSLKAVTGDYATSAHQEGYHVAKKVAALHAEMESVCTSDVLLHQVCGTFDSFCDTYHKYVVYTVGSLQPICGYMQLLCCLLMLDHCESAACSCNMVMLCSHTILFFLFGVIKYLRG